MGLVKRAVPFIDLETRPYWDGCQEGRLLYQRCVDCGHPQFYPRLLCTSCFSDKLEWAQSQGQGTVYSSVVHYHTFEAGFKEALPYVVALIDLDEGYRMMSNITGDDAIAVRIGDRVEVYFEKVNDEVAVPLFRSATGGSSSGKVGA